MTYKTAIKTLNSLLSEHRPTTFSSSWIYSHAPYVYIYISKNIRTENDDIDWDRITHSLDREFQKKWMRYRRRQVKQYENQLELDLITNKYKDKFYTFITPLDEKDKIIRNKIIVALTRLSQKGNILAQNALVYWVRFIIDDWIDKYPHVWRWRSFTDSIEDKIPTGISSRLCRDDEIGRFGNRRFPR